MNLQMLIPSCEKTTALLFINVSLEYSKNTQEFFVLVQCLEQILIEVKSVVSNIPKASDPCVVQRLSLMDRIHHRNMCRLLSAVMDLKNISKSSALTLMTIGETALSLDINVSSTCAEISKEFCIAQTEIAKNLEILKDLEHQLNRLS